VDEYNQYVPHFASNIKLPNEFYKFEIAAYIVQFLSAKSKSINTIAFQIRFRVVFFFSINKKNV